MSRSETPTNNPTTLAVPPSDGAFADAEDALWRQFGTADTREAFCAPWLALQCRMIGGVAGGVVLLGAPGGDSPFAPAAMWPDKQQDLKHLGDVAQRALTEQRGLVLKRQPTESQTRFDIAYPVQVSGQICGVVAMDIDPRPEGALRQAMRQLQWGAAWMEVLFHRSRAEQTAAPEERLQGIVSLLATLVSHERFHGAAGALVTAMATRFGCDRVSVGFVRRGSVRIEAVSHSAQFGKDTNLIRTIAAAMDEAVDQQQPIVFPEPADRRSLVTRDHAELVRQSGNGAALSIPFHGQGSGGIAGAITLERAGDRPFDDETVQLCVSFCALAGPILEVQRKEARWLLRKVVDSFRGYLGFLIGPRHVAAKLITVGVIAVVVFFVFAQGDYRVTAKTVLEPSKRQAVVAAFNGYLRGAPVRAGDVVLKGQELARLDDRELQLERSRWGSQEQQTLKQFYEALGSRNAAQSQILTAQLAQAKAQVALIDDQLARTSIVAPFDGVIVTGDLSQQLGAPVERGQVLFELAPLDSYRVILQVDERQIGDVQVGQRGQLALSGFVSDALDFSVVKMTPVSTANEGRNFFRVEAQFDTVRERLRPGMEGVGKVFVDRRLLAWIWSHEVIDWLRLKVWNWLP